VTVSSIGVTEMEVIINKFDQSAGERGEGGERVLGWGIERISR
jgi:hypothetical protein